MPTPQNIYVYLMGGRGDARVLAWDGNAPTQVDETEKGNPYRNSLPKSFDPKSSGFNALGGPGFTVIPTYAMSGGGLAINAAETIMDDAVTEMSGTAKPPRAWDKTVTWLIFATANGPRKFRKDLVIGWGDTART
jgi:hypothetical protein